MSKIKEHPLHVQELELMHMGKFLDYIYDNVVTSRLSGVELDEMERESSLPSKQEILSNKPFKVANNKNYFPRQGA